MKIRKLHRFFALSFAPFFILTSISGALLLLRKTGLFSKTIKSYLQDIHNWELLAPYIGIILAMGMIVVSITGIMVFLRRKP